MIFQALLFRFRWLHVPAGLLALLLQRTPVLRVLSASPSSFGLQPAAILKSAFALAALGAYDSVAGATVFNAAKVDPTTVSPAKGSANTTFRAAGAVGSAFSLSFNGSGAPSAMRSWKITGTLPAGLRVVNGIDTGTGIVANGSFVTLTGTPTVPVTSTLGVTAYDTAGARGKSARVSCAITIAGDSSSIAPVFTTALPATSSAPLGGDLILTVHATGTPAPTYAWKRGSVVIPGQTGATLALGPLTLADAATYTVTASNSGGLAIATTKLAVTLPPVATLADPGTLRVGSVVALDLRGDTPAFPGLLYKATGLPAGLTLDPTTGLLSGLITAKPGPTAIKLWTQLGTAKSEIQSATLTTAAYPVELTGAYEALLSTASEPALPFGKVTLAVSSTGTFTGKLISPEVAPFVLKNRLALSPDNTSASATFSIPRGKLLPPYSLTVTVAADTLLATLSESATPVAASTDGARMTTVAPAGAVNAYTALLTAPVNLGTAPAFPLGSGYATARIDAKGLLTLAGKHADGTALTGSYPLGHDNRYRIFAKPYAGAAGGYFSATLPLTPRTGDTTRWHVAPADGVDTYWRKPDPLAATTNYPDGFGPLALTVRIEPWIKPTPAVPLATLLGLAPSGDLSVNLSASGLAPADYALPDTLHLSATNLFTVVSTATPANPSAFSAKVNAATGALTGGFTLKAIPPVALRKVAYSGVLLQSAPDDLPRLHGGGFFLLPAAVKGAPVASGQVSLTSP
ncbi:MAG: immunoglobulin domain-containing protein [Opitutaceae bacterium]|jgi:hypothetical protein|nr:immunoglobulin domain-containing protein [Opitutaceae bacterium]